MVTNLKRFFTEATIFGAIGLTSVGIQAQTLPDIQTAQKTIKAANNAALDLVALSVVSAFNPTGKVITGTGTTIDIGIRKESCEKAIKAQKELGDIDSYAMAQKVLIDAGQLTVDKAKSQLATHSQYVKTIGSQMPNIEKACADLGIAMENKP